MPIYEFRCLKCNHCLEILVMNKDEQVEMKCSQCGSSELERIMSSTNYAMGGGGAAKDAASTQTRTCSSGSCTTWNLPGYSR